jgi:hypothetical protein
MGRRRAREAVGVLGGGLEPINMRSGRRALGIKIPGSVEGKQRASKL